MKAGFQSLDGLVSEKAVSTQGESPSYNNGIEPLEPSPPQVWVEDVGRLHLEIVPQLAGRESDVMFASTTTRVSILKEAFAPYYVFRSMFLRHTKVGGRGSNGSYHLPLRRELTQS